jgi:hypothetical protein
MRPPGSGGAPASAAFPLLDNVPHCLRRGALHLPARRAERGLCYRSDRLLMPTAAHFLYIPGVLLLGIVIGWILGSRAAADAYAAQLRRLKKPEP